MDFHNQDFGYFSTILSYLFLNHVGCFLDHGRGHGSGFKSVKGNYLFYDHSGS